MFNKRTKEQQETILQCLTGNKVMDVVRKRTYNELHCRAKSISRDYDRLIKDFEELDDNFSDQLFDEDDRTYTKRAMPRDIYDKISMLLNIEQID